jgi:hypothetical protein
MRSLNSNQLARWRADRRRQSRQHPNDHDLSLQRVSRGDHYRRKNNGIALRTFKAVKSDPHSFNPQPQDRVLIVFAWEPSLPGHFMPTWRVCSPGWGHAELACGDAWLRFIAFWRGLAEALRRWDRRGRPGPVFSHLSSSEQDWITEGA